MKKKPAHTLINSETTVYDLVATPVLDDFGHAELVVFLRLLVALDRYAPVRRMPVLNRELHADPRTVGRALDRLEERGVVRVRYDASGRRTIEVVR